MKKTNILIVVLLVFSLFKNYGMASDIEQLRNQINNMSNSMSNEIMNISSSVYQAADEMKKQALWVRESEIEVAKANDDYSDFEADLTFTINEKKNGEELYIIATSEDGGKSERIEIPESEGMTYSLQLELADDNYSFELMGTDEAGSRTEKLAGINLKGIANRMVEIDGRVPSIKFSHDPDIGTIDFYVTLLSVHPKVLGELSGLARDIDFKSIEADVYVGETKVDTIDLLSGKGYEKKNIEEITNEIPATPEFAGEETNLYQFVGTYMLEGEACSDYLQAQESGDRYAREKSEVFFLIRATDNKGNVYRGVFPDHFYQLDGDEIKFRM
ncbi:MAG: FlxA-like family protein [Peptostreptococcaceae bacterium]|nr:FlxA-like family protein [Peptostreptococcaceae bacterium]